MSYITDRLLTERLQKLHREQGGVEDVPVYVFDVRTHVHFRAVIGDKTVDFKVPEDALSSAPLSYVLETYMWPAVARIGITTPAASASS